MQLHLSSSSAIISVAFFFLALLPSWVFPVLSSTLKHLPNLEWEPATATWYGAADGDGSDGGACGYGSLVDVKPLKARVGAVSPILFKGGEGCGACYKVKCLDKSVCSRRAVTVIITDECPGGYCSAGRTHFDLSGAAFSRMAVAGFGSELRDRGEISVMYRRTPCKYPGKHVAFHVNEGSTNYWLSLLVEFEDGDGDVGAMHIQQVLEEVEGFCSMKKIPIPDMNDKVPARGHSRRNGQMIKFSHRYQVDIFLVVLDSLIVEMDARFGEASTKLLKCISSLDPDDSFSKFDNEKLLELAGIYSDDFSIIDRTFLRGELGTFITDVRNAAEFSDCHDIATLAVQMVHTKRHLCYPLTYRLIELILILPVATAVERAFSAMKIIKTDLRNKMSDEWMNDRMICYIEREIFASIDDEKILQRFQNMNTRKYQLPRFSN